MQGFNLQHKGIDISRTDCSNGLPELPEVVPGNMWAESCKLTSLKGCPGIIYGNFIIAHNNITRIDVLPKYIGGTINLTGNNIRSGMIKFLNVQDLQRIEYRNPFYFHNNPLIDCIELINDFIYHRHDRQDFTAKEMLQCRIKFHKLGLKEFI